MQTIKINAVDNLFFRDGKPFDIGDSVWARGMFPPSPSVLYGDLRSAYIAKDIDVLGNIKINDPTKALEIIKIGLVGSKLNNKGEEKNSLLFPLPRDIIALKKRDDEYNLKYLELHEKNIIASTHSTPYILKSSVKGKLINLAERAFLDVENFEAYLNKSTKLDYELLSDYTCHEPKVGIGRNRLSRTVEKGKLYRLDFLRTAQLVLMSNNIKRLNTLSIAIKFDKLKLDNNGLLRIGTDGKGASYTDFVFTEINCPVLDSCEFKIYLATPAIFQTGWKPSFQFFEDNDLELLSVSIGKSLPIGGFDIQANFPKKMYKAVPAGSVYYVKAKDIKSANELAQKLHGHSISDDMEYEFKKQGFGIVYVGKA